MDRIKSKKVQEAIKFIKLTAVFETIEEIVAS